MFGVPADQVLGVARQKVLHLFGGLDEMLHDGGDMGGGVELVIAEGVALAVVEAVFADAGEGMVLVVHRAVGAEFDETGLALGFLFFGGQFGGFGGFLGILVVVGGTRLPRCARNDS